MIRKVTLFVATLVAVALVAAILFPVFAKAKGCAKCTARISKVKQMGLAVAQYLYDHDDRFPPRDVWVDATYPYARSWTIYHVDPNHSEVWGYAFNGALDHAKTPKDAATVPMVYDSTNPLKNASDLVTSLPRPGRTNGKNLIAYADSHVKAVAP